MAIRLRRPWERRSKPDPAGNFTQRELATLIHRAETGPAGPLAARETAIGLAERCLVGARIEGDAHGALTPPLLGSLGRRLMADGEWLAVIEVEGGRVRLDPVSDWTVTGASPNPGSWIYAATIDGPSSAVTRKVGADGVVHVRFADPRRPWKGRSPLTAESALLRASLDRWVQVLADPGSALQWLTPTEGVRWNDDNIVALRHYIRRATGSAQVMPHRVERLDMTARLDEETRAAVDTARQAVTRASGVPDSVLGGRAGAGQREALRVLRSTLLRPVARLIEAECRVKLDSPDLRIRFDGLASGSDTQSYGRLIEAGVSPANAATITGLEIDPGTTAPEARESLLTAMAKAVGVEGP